MMLACNSRTTKPDLRRTSRQKTTQPFKTENKVWGKNRTASQYPRLLIIDGKSSAVAAGSDRGQISSVMVDSEMVLRWS